MNPKHKEALATIAIVLCLPVFPLFLWLWFWTTVLHDTARTVPRAIAAAVFLHAGLFLIAAPFMDGYGYFGFLRYFVSISAVLAFAVAFLGCSYRLGSAFVAVAVLFNPIIPVHLSRMLWLPIDIIVAGLFACLIATIGSLKLESPWEAKRNTSR